MEIWRNGKTCVVVGSSMYFSLENNVIPLLTTKKVAWKTCLRELLWFVRGQTNNKILTDQKCNIWKGNASREFLDSRGLSHLREDDFGVRFMDISGVILMLNIQHVTKIIVEKEWINFKTLLIY